MLTVKRPKSVGLCRVPNTPVKGPKNPRGRSGLADYHCFMPVVEGQARTTTAVQRSHPTCFASQATHTYVHVPSKISTKQARE